MFEALGEHNPLLSDDSLLTSYSHDINKEGLLKGPDVRNRLPTIYYSAPNLILFARHQWLATLLSH
jgi:hypothetical protein